MVKLCVTISAMKTHISFLIFGIICISGLQTINGQSNFITPALPSIPIKTFNITEFGAISDNAIDNTVPIQKAIEAANSAGGGIVIVPRGIFLSGPIHFNSTLDLQLDEGAILKFLPIDKYPGGTTTGTD